MSFLLLVICWYLKTTTCKYHLSSETPKRKFLYYSIQYQNLPRSVFRFGKTSKSPNFLFEIFLTSGTHIRKVYVICHSKSLCWGQVCGGCSSLGHSVKLLTCCGCEIDVRRQFRSDVSLSLLGRPLSSWSFVLLFWSVPLLRIDW